MLIWKDRSKGTNERLLLIPNKHFVYVYVICNYSRSMQRFAVYKYLTRFSEGNKNTFVADEQVFSWFVTFPNNTLAFEVMENLFLTCQRVANSLIFSSWQGQNWKLENDSISLSLSRFCQAHRNYLVWCPFFIGCRQLLDPRHILGPSKGHPHPNLLHPPRLTPDLLWLHPPLLEQDQLWHRVPHGLPQVPGGQAALWDQLWKLRAYLETAQVQLDRGELKDQEQYPCIICIKDKKNTVIFHRDIVDVFMFLFKSFICFCFRMAATSTPTSPWPSSTWKLCLRIPTPPTTMTLPTPASSWRSFSPERLAITSYRPTSPVWYLSSWPGFRSSYHRNQCQVFLQGGYNRQHSSMVLKLFFLRIQSRLLDK